MPSGWVGLPQITRLSVSDRVVLRLPPPGAVVTWFVTGSESLRFEAHFLDFDQPSV